MSNFGSFLHVRTRKEHLCETCCRTIPVGKRAYNYRGKYEDIWQNWYMCAACVSNDVQDDNNDEISGYEFYEWMRVQPFAKCPQCGERYDDFDFASNDEDIHFSCGVCEHEWDHHIGFDAKEGYQDDRPKV